MVFLDRARELDNARIVKVNGDESRDLTAAYRVRSIPTLLVFDDRVFAAGDCAALDGHDLPKLGVFGVRQERVSGCKKLRARH